MSDNFYANWTSADDEEQKRRAWEALASQSDEAPHRTLANQVQLPEMSVVAARPPRSPDMDFTAPGNEPADFAPTERGNIDLGNRPHVRNPDGSTSTVYSMGENVDGKEMLLPGVNDMGYVMTPDQAHQEYLRTGKNLGQFKDPATSDAYGELLHLRQMENPPEDTLRGRGGPGYDLTPPEPDSSVAPGTDAQKSPEMPPDAPSLARLGASLQQRDAAPEAPPAPRPEYHSSNEGQTTWTGTALAALADILLNRGRGVGGVLALGAQGQSPMAKAELDLKRAQAEHLRNPTTDPATMAYKQAMLDLQREQEARKGRQGDASIELRGQGQQGVQGRFDKHRMDVVDPNSQYNQTQVLQAGQRAGASAQGRIGAEHDLNGVVTGDKAQIAGAEAAARIGAGHDLAPVTTADEANKAREVGYAGNEPKLAYEQSMNPVLAERNNGGMGVGLSAEGLMRDNPGLEFADPEQLQRAMRTRTINAQTLDKLQASNRAREILDSMYKTIADFQSGPKTAESYYGASKQLDSHAQEYAGMMGRIAGTQNQEQVRADVARVPNLLNPLALTGVKKLWEAADANIRGNLGTLGIHARAPSFGQQPTDADGTPGTPAIDATNPTPSASPAKGDYANYSRDTSDPNNLGKAPVPKIPSAAQRGTNISPRNVTKPNGKTTIENLSDEEAATLNARQGWRVE